jgi:hypothetical protein
MDDLSATIARVRRAMPRNADVMRICDETRVRSAAQGPTIHACGAPLDGMVQPD